MNAWLIFTTTVVKLAIFGLRIIGKNGTALPGYIAERMYPSISTKLASSLTNGVWLVTGTNGKTTTSKVIRELLEARGVRVLSNRSGSNFTRGIIGSMIENLPWFNLRLDYDMAIFEVDEAYAPAVASQLSPKLLLALNVMRDQLDRYGEIDTTAKLIAKATKYCEGVVINADDSPLLDAVMKVFPNKKLSSFSVAEKLKTLLPSDKELLDSTRQKSKTRNPSLIQPAITLSKWVPETSLLEVSSDGGKLETKLSFEGIHNAQNVLAALAAVRHVFGKLSNADMKALANIKPAFGRGEKLVIDGKNIHIALIKNPAGFNQNIRAFAKSNVGMALIVINDQYADGRDVSWLWDVDLTPIKQLDSGFIAGGVRAYDMALRLKYEDIDVLSINTLIKRALEYAIDATPKGKDLLIMPTYTAMLEIRKILSKQTEMDRIWQ